jgi:pyruvate dehydrogenase E2 component (dihydrolipoamide acetyltransferase)
MAEVILMPRLSDTMTEGVIAAWHKKVGDSVKKGDLLAEVETDKATMDLESYKDGTLLYTGTDKGGKIQVNDLLAIIGSARGRYRGPGEGRRSWSGRFRAGSGRGQCSGGAKGTTMCRNSRNSRNGGFGGGCTRGAGAAGPEAWILSKQEEVILMPRLSDTMTEGVIADWHKKVGDAVKKGDILADIETDKATMELESYKEGKLLYIGAQKGEKIAVNDLLAVIGDEKKVDLEKIVAASKNKGAAPVAAAAPASAATHPMHGLRRKAPAASGETGGLSVSADGRIKASPLAKKLAAEKGIDISKVAGSGDNGRIIKKDVDSYTPGTAQAAAASQPASGGKAGAPAVPLGQVSYEEIPVSQMRKVIAKRLGGKYVHGSAFLCDHVGRHGQGGREPGPNE